MVAAGGPVRARVSARRSASGSRYRPAMRRTRSAASAAGIPAAVTNSGRAEDPRTTGTAWVAVRNRDLATPMTGMPNSACACAPRPGQPGGPGRRSRRPPAGPARSDPPGPRAAAGARAGRTHPAGRALPGAPPRCVRPARARKRHRRPARLRPGRRRPEGNGRPRRRTRRRPGVRRFPCLEHARTCAGRRASGPYSGGRRHGSAASGPAGHEA